MIQALIFDWGNTVMRDFPEKPGPMAHWDHVELIPGIESALEALQKKYTLCIASNAGFSGTILMIEALKRVGAEKYFQHCFTSKDLGYEKPDARFFGAILKKINLRPEECIMIGDHYGKDVCGAKTIGMQTVFFNEKNSTGSFPHADRNILQMSDLCEAIEWIEKRF